MMNEIKEDVTDLMELLETASKKNFYRLTMDHELVVRLYNYITNLQQENKQLKDKFLKQTGETFIRQERIDKALRFLENCSTIDEELVCYVIKLLKGEE